MARNILKEKKLPQNFWAEAVSCTTYVLNRCLIKSVPNKILKEAWSGRKPSKRHLQVFYSITYAHVPKHIQNKFDDKVIKCIFIGYCDNMKVYKLYNLAAKKVIVSRDVILMKQNNGIGKKKGKEKHRVSFNFEEAIENREEQVLESPHHVCRL